MVMTIGTSNGDSGLVKVDLLEDSLRHHNNKPTNINHVIQVIIALHFFCTGSFGDLQVESNKCCSCVPNSYQGSPRTGVQTTTICTVSRPKSTC